VSDVVTLARNARESLARGLNALQGDPNVPRQLLELAAPIAQAMGALHQIERSSGAPVTQSAQTALSHLQTALAQLQAQPPQHPAVAQALEAVAGALGIVHSLARAVQPTVAAPAVAAAPAPARAYAAAPQVPRAAPTGRPAAAAAANPAAARPAQAAPAAATAPVAPAAPAPAPAPPVAVAPAPAPAPQPAYRPAPQPAYNVASAQPAAQPRPAAPPAQPAPTAPTTGRGPVDPSAIGAELGAHSPSNFYKGLSGNDIIDHGGLFVSTYKLPKIGQPVRLRVALPGGYEFEANAVVRWRREPSDAGNDAPPGFGAQFTEITAEARQLVYRYVRNREPLFHDDL